MTVRLSFPSPGAGVPLTSGELSLPQTIESDGLLVGWSMEHEHVRRPIGFSFGDPENSPQTGFIDPILMVGEGHLLTIAPTGAGKGVGCIVPALLRHQGPVIVVDPKGENASVTARRRRELGQQVIVLDPMGISGQPQSTLNPLDLVSANSASGVDDAASLVGTLLPMSFQDDRNTYWWSRAQQLLTAILLHVVTDYPPEQRKLTKVREIVNALAGDVETHGRAMANSRHPEVRLIQGNLAIAARETLGSIISFAQEGVDFIRGPLVQEATDRSSFSLDAVTRGDPLSVYLVLPPHMLESHGRLLRLWIGTLMTSIMRRRRKPDKPTLFILDEAAQLGELAELRQAVTLLRGYGLQTWSFWQDVSQIKQNYRRDWETIINNCRVIQAFGANNMNAADAMAGLLGFVSGPTMLDLEQEEMFLQIAGDEAVIAKRPNYLTDPVFAGAFDLNPLFDPALEPVPEPHMIREYLRPEKMVIPAPAPPLPDLLPGAINPVDKVVAADLLRYVRRKKSADQTAK